MNTGNLKKLRITPGQEPTEKQGPESYNHIELN